MRGWTLCLLLFGFLLLEIDANSTIVIHGFFGTDRAQLGSNTTTLKCDYDYVNDTEVVIKFFYNDNTQIFLWVPHNDKFKKPQAMGPFSELLEVTSNSIHFKDITRNVTGNYTCKVSSLEGEKSETHPLIAYQPATKIELVPEDVSETVICSAYELYPVPVITVSARYTKSNETIALDSAEAPDVTETDGELYNVTKTVKFNKASLEGGVEFICKVEIPETSYVETKVAIFEQTRNDSTAELPISETETNNATINFAKINPTSPGQVSMSSNRRPPSSLFLLCSFFYALFAVESFTFFLKNLEV